MESCVFCKIYKCRLGILYEDEESFLIADIAPLSPGHLLLVSREHFEFLHEVPDKVLSRTLLSVKEIVTRVGFRRYNVLQNNGHMQSVPHFHVHIVPANEEGSLSVRWETMEVAESELESLRAKVKKALS